MNTRFSISLAVACGLAESLAGCAGYGAPPTPQGNAESQCQAFLGRTFEGATVTRAKLEPPTATAPESCVVLAEMPQDLDFEVRMPTAWNSRTLFIGGGGFDGVIVPSAHSTGLAQAGYATIATNHGHNGDPLSAEATWALDTEMLAEYGYLSVPRVLAPAKAILRIRYGEQRFAAAKMVYEGCSGGGRQGLMQAQRYPELFDGVISRAPANAFTAQFLWYQKVAKQLAKPGSGLTSGKVRALASAVLAKCDALDGLEDGVIGRPDACTFDVASMKCTGAETDSCLTDLQVQTVKAIYEPTKVAGYEWPGFPFGGEAASPTGHQAWGGSGSRALGDGFIRYMVARNPSANWLELDPAQYTARLASLAGQIDAVSPDLSRFKARGGKLILWTGLTDWLITPNNATDYYTKVVTAAGGQAQADEFVEYFTAPGVDHCRNGRPGGTGQGADFVNLVDPMFDWIEKGVKPSSVGIVATQSNPAAGQTAKKRPLCKYPEYAKYNGTGDPNLATSFACVKP
jgi:pimeloyl-ACP methyl ester carboxylesterase